MLGIVKLYVIIWDLIFLVQLRIEAMDSTFRRTAVIIWGNIDGKSKSQKTQNILLQTQINYSAGQKQDFHVKMICFNLSKIVTWIIFIYSQRGFKLVSVSQKLQFWQYFEIKKSITKTAFLDPGGHFIYLTGKI